MFRNHEQETIHPHMMNVQGDVVQLRVAQYFRDTNLLSCACLLVELIELITKYHPVTKIFIKERYKHTPSAPLAPGKAELW